MPNFGYDQVVFDVRTGMMERESRQSRIYRFRRGFGAGLVHGHGHVYVEEGKVDGKGVWR
jgi:hypothetical protein